MTIANPSAPLTGEGAAPAKDNGDPPKYKLKAPAYIDNTLYDQAMIDRGVVIFFEGIPGPHMHPMNDAARAMVREHKPVAHDPVEALTIVGPAATVLKPHTDPDSSGGNPGE